MLKVHIRRAGRHFLRADGAAECDCIDQVGRLPPISRPRGSDRCTYTVVTALQRLTRGAVAGRCHEPDPDHDSDREQDRA